MDGEDETNDAVPASPSMQGSTTWTGFIPRRLRNRETVINQILHCRMELPGLFWILIRLYLQDVHACGGILLRCCCVAVVT